MDYEGTMVDEEFDEAVEDDAPLDDFVEEDESEEEEEEFYDEEDLEIPDEDDEEETPEEEPEPEPKSEPGWIKQRVGKAVEKAIRETEARMQAKFDEQLAPLLEKMMDDEARELVKSGEVRNLETAKELVRLRRGQPQEVTPQQPRNEQGQFVSKEQIAREAAVDARVKELTKQADKIRANGGPDVVKEFKTNEDIKQRVIDGELDFYDVAEMMSKPKRRPPSPAHSSNGATNYATANAFANMSSKQFQRMEKQIDKGVRYSVK